jgi:1,4-alpha-glucan branching enzyme
VLLAYMFTRPGKKLMFMGAETATWHEWHHDASLDWHLVAEGGERASHLAFVERLGNVYRQRPSLWRGDESWDGFSWIDIADRQNSVIAYMRCDADERTVVVLNLTPVPREGYRIGVPAKTRYEVILNSDDNEWGGSGYASQRSYEAEAAPFHGFAQSIVATLPPLSALILGPTRGP